jgi:hypothetical protein
LAMKNDDKNRVFGRARKCVSPRRHLSPALPAWWVTSFWLVLMTVLPGRSETNSSAAFPSRRYVLVVETSKAMQRRTQGILDTLQGYVSSGLNGNLRRGDKLNLWTFNENVYTNWLPLKDWSPETQSGVAAEFNRLVKAQNFERRANFEALNAELTRAFQQKETVTYIVISAAEDNLKGTPFDDQISQAYTQWRDQQQKARMPVVTMLRSRAGTVSDWSVTPAPWALELPPYRADFEISGDNGRTVGLSVEKKSGTSTTLASVASGSAPAPPPRNSVARKTRKDSQTGLYSSVPGIVETNQSPAKAPNQSTAKSSMETNSSPAGKRADVEVARDKVTNPGESTRKQSGTNATAPSVTSLPSPPPKSSEAKTEKDALKTLYSNIPGLVVTNQPALSKPLEQSFAKAPARTGSSPAGKQADVEVARDNVTSPRENTRKQSGTNAIALSVTSLPSPPPKSTEAPKTGKDSSKALYSSIPGLVETNQPPLSKAPEQTVAKAPAKTSSSPVPSRADAELARDLSATLALRLAKKAATNAPSRTNALPAVASHAPTTSSPPKAPEVRKAKDTLRTSAFSAVPGVIVTNQPPPAKASAATVTKPSVTPGLSNVSLAASILTSKLALPTTGAKVAVVPKPAAAAPATTPGPRIVEKQLGPTTSPQVAVKSPNPATAAADVNRTRATTPDRPAEPPAPTPAEPQIAGPVRANSQPPAEKTKPAPGSAPSVGASGQALTVKPRAVKSPEMSDRRQEQTITAGVKPGASLSSSTEELKIRARSEQVPAATGRGVEPATSTASEQPPLSPPDSAEEHPVLKPNPQAVLAPQLNQVQMASIPVQAGSFDLRNMFWVTILALALGSAGFFFFGWVRTFARPVGTVRNPLDEIQDE